MAVNINAWEIISFFASEQLNYGTISLEGIFNDIVGRYSPVSKPDSFLCEW